MADSTRTFKLKLHANSILGPEFSARRMASVFALSFAVATAIRIVCLSPRLPVFGQHLQKDLAPIERDDVSWLAIAIQRVIDLTLGFWVISTSTSKVDGFLLGLLFTGISRHSVLHFVHHHFLLSFQTASEVLLTDAVSMASALGLMAKFLPRQPSFRPSARSFIGRHLNAPSLKLIGASLGLAICLNSLLSYVADRVYLHQLMKAGVLEHTVPAYFAQYSTASIMRYPSLPVPLLRSDFRPLSMITALVNSLPFVLSAFTLLLFVIPALSSYHLTALVFLITAPSQFITLWNLFPIQIWAAGVAALGAGFRQALVSWVLAEVLLDLRRPVEITTAHRHEKVVGAEIDGSKLVETQS